MAPLSTLLLARLMGQYCFARWFMSSSSVVVCNTPRRACRRLHAQARRWHHAASGPIISPRYNTTRRASTVTPL